MMGKGKAIYLEYIQHKKMTLFVGTTLWVLLLLLSGIFIFSSTKMAILLLFLGIIIFGFNIVERAEVRATLDKRGDRYRFYSEIEELEDPREFIRIRLLVLEHYIMSAQGKLHLYTYDELQGIEVVSERYKGKLCRVLYVELKKDNSRIAIAHWQESDPEANRLEEAVEIMWNHMK